MYNEIIQKLADMFFVSAEYVQVHFWEYVLMYGKYEFWSTLRAPIFVAAFFSAFVIWVWFSYEDQFGDIDNITFKKIAIIVAGITALIIVLYTLPYVMSPEMYSLKAVMRLTNNG
jgi:hypothetical protein